MKILIDIVHIGDLNFYSNSVLELKKGNEVTITVLRRGNLPEVARSEFPDLEIIEIGRHRKSGLMKIIGLFTRELSFVSLFLKRRFDIVSSFGFYPAIAAKLFGIKSVLFHDDKEYKMVFGLCKRFGDVFIVPESLDVSAPNIKKVNGFKELAFLQEFAPKKEALKKYGLSEDKYVFFRDVSNISLNYKGQKGADLSPLFEHLGKKGFKILYYPEDSKEGAKYSSVTLLKSPLKDIHSLMYYAKFCISTGDTIARESALLGTPVIFASERNMEIMKPLIDLGAIKTIKNGEEMLRVSDSLISGGNKLKLRKKIKSKISKEWPSWSKMITKEILSAKDRNN